MMRFVYIAFGPSTDLTNELRYSIETLLAEGIAPGQISIYTDTPARFAGSGFEINNIADDLRDMTWAMSYHFRAKPLCLRDCLARHQTPCVLIDTDTFVTDGFCDEVRAALGRGVGMNFFIRSHPYPDIGAFETTLPSGRVYIYDPKAAQMFNSGLVALGPHHLPLMDDVIALMDALRRHGGLPHDVEQFAFTETFRLHGVLITTVDKTFVHYCSTWRRRNVRLALSKREPMAFADLAPVRPYLKLSKGRDRLLKFSHMVRRILQG